MEFDIKTTVGNNVRAAREARGLTQEQFAEAIGRHIDSISLIERGKTLPSLDTIVSIAQVVGVEIDALVSEYKASSPSSTDRSFAELVFRLKNLSQERRDFVEHIVKMLEKLS